MFTINQILRTVFFALDNVIYSFISTLYELIIYLSNVNLINNNDTLQGLIQRIYLILGIFMLFKVTFSIMQYLIDPNSFSDQSKGFTKLVTNAILSLILLVMVPWIFQKAYEFQAIIINSNAIPNLVLGTKMDDYSKQIQSGRANVTDVESAVKSRQQWIRSLATDVQFAMYGAFFRLNTNPDELGGAFADCAPTANSGATTNVIGSNSMASNEACLTAFKNELDDDSNSFGTAATKLKYFFKYYDPANTEKADSNGVVDERRFSALGDLLPGNKDEIHMIDYIWLLPALAGGYLIFLLITFAIDIAARVFKLVVLQAIAPIAIISYIDPKESASNGRLHNWVMECIKTYLSLFLRLLLVFLAIMIIGALTESMWGTLTADGSGIYNVGIKPDTTMNIFVFVFLVLGLFTVVKRIPQLIEGIFNIKFEDLTMNPLKAIRDNAGARALAGGLIGGGLGAASGVVGATATAISNGKSPLRGVGGLFSGFASGFRGGAQTKGDFGKARALGINAGGRVSRRTQVRYDTGGWRGMPSMLADRALYAMGGQSTFEMMERSAKRSEDVEVASGELMKQAGELAADTNDWKVLQAERMRLEERRRTDDSYTEQEYVNDTQAIQNQEYALVSNQIATSTDSRMAAARTKLAKALKDSGNKDFKKAGNLASYLDQQATAGYQQAIASIDNKYKSQQADHQRRLDAGEIDADEYNNLMRSLSDKQNAEVKQAWDARYRTAANNVKKDARNAKNKIRSSAAYNDAADKHHGITNAADQRFKKG